MANVVSMMAKPYRSFFVDSCFLKPIHLVTMRLHKKHPLA